MRYPYDLETNPYPSSPTPSLADTQILGGQTHKKAKSAIVSCITELYSKLGDVPTDRDFRLITMIQDVGSGKTHLALHIKGLCDLGENTITSYVDLAQVWPRDIHNHYDAILGGFGEDDIRKLRHGIIHTMVKKAENDKNARKIFNYGIKDRIAGRSISQKADLFINGHESLNYVYLHDVLSPNFRDIEIEIIKSLLNDKLRSDVENIRSLEGVINSLSAITTLNLKILGKLTVFQFDEFDANRESLDFIKAFVNAHIPSSVMMLILTPSSYNDIRAQNVSVFDRLEKANYKIDLAGSNTITELLDIIFEYIRYYDYNKIFDANQEKDLASKVRVIFNEFPDFRNVRSMLNIMYHATENSARNGSPTIDEEAMDETIKSAYPGLKIRGSLMDVPISEFIKIRKSTNDVHLVETDIREAVKNLLACTNYTGNVKELNFDNSLGDGIDVVYNDSFGSKVAVSIAMDKDYNKINSQISNVSKSVGLVDKLVILTNANTSSMRVNNGNNHDRTGTTVVNMDKEKIIDLLYFNNKFKSEEILNEDLLRAITLAKSIKLC